MRIKVRKASRQEDKPNPQKELVESLVKCTDEELIEKLKTITQWEWAEQDDMYNWADLLNKFDDTLGGLARFLEKKTIIDLPIPKSDFPRELVLTILRFSLMILENCVNRQVYASVEHLTRLLKLDDTEIVLAVLSLIAAYVTKVQLRMASHQPIPPSLNTQLFYLAKGWGGKQDGLGLHFCTRQDDVSSKLAVGSTLHFEFYVNPVGAEPITEPQTEETEPATEGAKEVAETKTEETPVIKSDDKKEQGDKKEEAENIGAPLPGQTVIHLPHLQRFKESNLEILEQLVKKYKIPKRYHFPLLIRIRLARAFPSLEERRNFIRINLLAFTTLAEQAQSDVSLMNSFFLYEPEYISELMELVRSDSSLPADFRILSLRALTALLSDNTRLPNLISTTGCSQHHGELPSMIRKSVATLTGGVEHPIYTLPFIEALFTFLSSLMATQEGIIALNNAGAIASLLPLLNDTDTRHVSVLLKCLNILEFYISASSSAVSSSASMSLFRDLGGLDSLVARFNQEIVEAQKLLEEGAAPMDVDEGKGKEKITESERKEIQLDHKKRQLVKTLARVILPFVQGGRRRNVGRLTSLIEGPFPVALRSILQHYDFFGEAIFSNG